MKVEIEGNEIRIKGKNHGVSKHGSSKHIKIWVREDGDYDEYSISIISDGMERGGHIPRIRMDRDHVIVNRQIIG